MPELPEVETSRRGIEPHLVGATILHAVVRNGRLRWPVSEEIYRLSDQPVLSVQRRAKYLLLELPEGWIIIHLGWLQTDAIRLYIPGEWISVWQVELPDVARKQIPTILPALLEEELNQDIDELHFAPLKIDQQLATVAVIHQQNGHARC